MYPAQTAMRPTETGAMPDPSSSLLPGSTALASTRREGQEPTEAMGEMDQTADVATVQASGTGRAHNAAVTAPPVKMAAMVVTAGPLPYCSRHLTASLIRTLLEETVGSLARAAEGVPAVRAAPDWAGSRATNLTVGTGSTEVPAPMVRKGRPSCGRSDFEMSANLSVPPTGPPSRSVP